jgi:thioredoxin-like negative regulator of GroEL
MSEPTRREKIEAMLAEDPSDTFLRYSLAMELQKEGRHAESLARFEELMGESPPHVPAFFMAAKLFVELDRRDDARRMLRSGIEEARKQNDAHAASEMAEMLTALGPQG